MGSNMKLADMTYVEVKQYLNTNDKLILPIGTCEQHGAHLPLSQDILAVEYFAGILSQNTNTVMAPTVNYGVNLPCDKLMSGTATLSPGLLREIILSVTKWWKAQGFKHFILLTFHGDPYHLEALSNLGNDIALIEPYEIDYSDILKKQSAMRHACEAETSVALYLYPEKVKMDLIRENDIPFCIFEDYLFHRKEAEPENYVGNLGFPSAATAEKGRRLVERMTDKMMADYSALGFDRCK